MKPRASVSRPARTAASSSRSACSAGRSSSSRSCATAPEQRRHRLRDRNFDPMGVHTATRSPSRRQRRSPTAATSACGRGAAHHPRDQDRGGRLQHPVLRPSRHGRDAHHRNEPARLAQLRAREQGDGLPDREDLRAARGRSRSARSRTTSRRRRPRASSPRSITRGEDPALGVREVPASPSAASARVDEVGRRSHGDRPHVPEALLKGWLRSRPAATCCPRPRRRSRWNRFEVRCPSRTPTACAICFDALAANVTPAELSRLTGIDPWFLHQMKRITDFDHLLLRHGLGRRTAMRAASGSASPTATSRSASA